MTEQKSSPDSRMQRIARKATKRVKLIAQRFPRATDLRKAVEKPQSVEKVVVISDTHFGDPTESLTSRRLIDSVMDVLKGLGDIDELVLLGDIFDFWKSPISDSMESGREFMSELFMLDNVGHIVFIPGNHDHHIFMSYYDEQVSRRLRSGELELPELTMPMTTECPFMDALKPQKAKVPLSMVYPIHQVLAQGKKVLLTHGHLLGFFERSLWNPRRLGMAALIIRKSEKLELEDMERFIAPFYEMLVWSAFIPGVRDGSYRLYRFLDRTGKRLGLQGDPRESAYRGTTVEQSAADIEALLDHFCDEKPDYFIYGHTHEMGRLELPLSGTTAINTGCWLSDGVPESAKNNILEISDRATMIRVEP